MCSLCASTWPTRPTRPRSSGPQGYVHEPLLHLGIHVCFETFVLVRRDRTKTTKLFLWWEFILSHICMHAVCIHLLAIEPPREVETCVRRPQASHKKTGKALRGGKYAAAGATPTAAKEDTNEKPERGETSTLFKSALSCTCYQTRSTKNTRRSKVERLCEHAGTHSVIPRKVALQDSYHVSHTSFLEYGLRA